MICFGRLFRRKSSKTICEIAEQAVISSTSQPSSSMTVTNIEENEVSASNDADQLTVTVISPTGRIARLSIPNTILVHELKLKAIDHFTQSTDVLMYFTDNINEIARQYKLMKIDFSEDDLPHMTEDHTLQVLGVQNFGKCTYE